MSILPKSALLGLVLARHSRYKFIERSTPELETFHKEPNRMQPEGNSRGPSIIVAKVENTARPNPRRRGQSRPPQKPSAEERAHGARGEAGKRSGHRQAETVHGRRTKGVNEKAGHGVA